MQTKEEQDQARAKSQAEAQLSSIREMVAALTRETAAKVFVRDLTREQLIALLDEANGVGTRDEDSDDDLRQEAEDAMIDDEFSPHDFEFDEEEARQRIQEDALSVEIRSGWCSGPDDMKPEEYAILLCTGGPACRIIGSLSEHGDPESASIQYQDWFTPWVDYPLTAEEEADVVKYAQQFYFGQ